jgi:hypothetical protein
MVATGIGILAGFCAGIAEILIGEPSLIGWCLLTVTPRVTALWSRPNCPGLLRLTSPWFVVHFIACAKIHMPVTTATHLQTNVNWSLEYFDVTGCANALLSTTKMLVCLDLAFEPSMPVQQHSCVLGRSTFGHLRSVAGIW